MRGTFITLALASALAVTAVLGVQAGAKTIHDRSGLSISPVSFMKLPGWANDHHGEALEAFRRSCTRLLPMAEKTSVGTGLLAGNAEHWHRACVEANGVDPQDYVGARAFFEREFVPYRLAFNNDPKGKLTGYYEPLLRGSWKQNAGYNEPVYAPPADLQNGEVYPLTRTDIDNGALAGKGLERLYIDNPIDLFFLHVQGSGRVLMDTGEMVSLRFAAKNNQPYTAIGKVLVERGALTKEEVSAPAIRHWLSGHPGEARDIMRRNASYIFFHVTPEVAQGPAGAQNVPLIPERSLAVDVNFIPLGMPIWLSTTLPDSAHGRGARYERLVVAQDKGSAIVGAIRGDVFFGYGDRAEDLAGHMNSEGTFVALVPKTLARQLEGKRY